MSQNHSSERPAGPPDGSRPPRLGIVGGGQLARMTALAAAPLGIEVVALEKSADCPAAAVVKQLIVGNWNEAPALLELASLVDVVTLENEFVSSHALETMVQAGHRLNPTVATLRLVQDKLVQKRTLAEVGLAVPVFAAVANPEELRAQGQRLGWPLVLKTRRNGYDGKGNFTLRSEADISTAWEALGGGTDKHALYVEAFCPYVSELAVIITRTAGGAMAEYPVVETVQRDHICHIVRAPAAVSPETAKEAARLARRAIETIKGVGSFGVEMFLLADGRVLINELAPRVHNSGHYTIEGCVCSQFENHVRAVLGWPLGPTTLRAPASVMVNLLGVGPGPGRPFGLERALTIPGAHVHVYGKGESKAGRKMGHVTALGASVADAEKLARLATDTMRFGNNP